MNWLKKEKSNDFFAEHRQNEQFLSILLPQTTPINIELIGYDVLKWTKHGNHAFRKKMQRQVIMGV